MKCPKCGGLLDDTVKRVVQPRVLARAEYGKKATRITKLRRALICQECKKVFVRSFALLEVDVIGN